MSFVDWLIFIIPLLTVMGFAVYSRKYVRGVADFLAAGRVAGRYVICVGDMQAGLSVMTLIAACEGAYMCGIGITYWNAILTPIGIFLALTGYCVYRYRQTKCLSVGQFLEIRYNRPFRILAAIIRTLAEMITNSIGPAVAARFFIYFFGLPITINIFGIEVSSFILVMMFVLILALIVIWVGGRISLLVTDAIQGIMSYPIFVIFTVFVLTEISWNADVTPVMLNRAAGESFLNPMDIDSLRDFNLFALVVAVVGAILNRAAWIGNDTTSAGRNAHEQKMAGILGAWRNGFALLMFSLISLFLITVMNANKFAQDAQEVRVALISKVADETISNKVITNKIIAESKAIPLVDPNAPTPVYSRADNPDAAYLKHVQANLASQEDGNTVFQNFRTLYYQMMLPILLRHKLPIGIMGLFALLMVMLMLSTDDSRIFNSASTIIQDIIMPFRKKPFEKKEHLMWLRIMSIAVSLFFFFISIFLAQLDFIMMFVNIMCALWLGAAGPIMVGGLYTKWGNTTGAFCALIFGSGTSILGIFLQRCWSSVIYPYLETSGNIVYVENVFNYVTALCSPYIVWEMNPVKFPINSYEIYFLAMILGCAGYVIGSLLTKKDSFNLDRMLYRGKYNDGESVENKIKWSFKTVFSKLIGIDSEYTKGDKVIAWSVFAYSLVLQFGIIFLGSLIWNMISPWPAHWWSNYFYISLIVMGIIIGTVSTVWFMIGGALDIRRLFHDLGKRVDDPNDDGWIEEK